MQPSEFDLALHGHAAFAVEPDITSSAERDTFLFRGFRVYPFARQLTRDGETVEIGGRAFDLLVVLLRARGRVVSKEEIFRAVWPCTTVDESNLRFQMTVLRRLLGADRNMIKTVAGRGYLLAEEIGDEGVTRTSRHDEKPHAPGSLPERVRARMAALESENSLLRRALSELALNRLFPESRAAA